MTGNARREFRLPKQGYGVPNPPPNLDGWLDRPLSVITGGHPAPLGPAPDFLGVGSPRERRGSHPHPRIEYGAGSSASSGQAPGPLVKGEGEEPPSQSSPQMGEEGDHPCPSAPLDSGFRRNDGVMPGSPSVSSTGRLCAGMTVGSHPHPSPLPSRERG